MVTNVGNIGKAAQNVALQALEKTAGQLGVAYLRPNAGQKMHGKKRRRRRRYARPKKERSGTWMASALHVYASEYALTPRKDSSG